MFFSEYFFQKNCRSDLIPRLGQLLCLSFTETMFFRPRKELRAKIPNTSFPTQYSQFLLKIFYIYFSFIYTPYLEMQSSKLEMGYNEK